MARLVLHIGTEKTGTTYFQRALKDNVAILKAQGIGYPEFCEQIEHVELWRAVAPVSAPLYGSGTRSADDVEIEREALQRNLASLAASASTSIMTDEHLSIGFGSTQIADLHALLRAAFDEVDVVIFLRRHDYFYPSWYSTAMKSGATDQQGRAFLERAGDKFRRVPIVRIWREFFGANHVHVRPYLERYKNLPDEVSTQILELATGSSRSVAAEQIARWRRPDRLPNPSLSGPATEVLRILNPFVPAVTDDGRSNSKQRGQLIRAIANRFPGPAVKLTDESLAAVTELLLSENDQLSELIIPSPDWDEWADQPTPTTAALQLPELSELAKTIAELSAPRGPIYWGGAPAEV